MGACVSAYRVYRGFARADDANLAADDEFFHFRVVTRSQRGELLEKPAFSAFSDATLDLGVVASSEEMATASESIEGRYNASMSNFTLEDPIRNAGLDLKVNRTAAMTAMTG